MFFELVVIAINKQVGIEYALTPLNSFLLALCAVPMFYSTWKRKLQGLRAVMKMLSD